MDTNMTFGQFVTFCENYKYTKEYFDFLKETKELGLIERYLENQEFALYNSEPDMFTEGYLVESVGEDTYERLYTSFIEKANESDGKIMAAIRKVGQTLCKFLAKVFGIIIVNDGTIEAALDFFTDGITKCSEQDFIDATIKSGLCEEKSLNALIEDNKKKSPNPENVKASQSAFVRTVIASAGETQWGFDDVVGKTNESTISNRQYLANDCTGVKLSGMAKAYVQAALTKSGMVINLSGKTCPKLEDLLDAYTIITTVNDFDPGELANKLNKAAKARIEIKTDEKSFKDLKAVVDKLSESLRASTINPLNPHAVSSGDLHKLNTIIHEQVATITKVFNRLAVYRKRGTYGFAKLAMLCQKMAGKNNKK